MVGHAARGTKRKCQNEVCALPFYDLNRADYTCPNCGAAFDVTVLERAASTAQYRMPRLQAIHIAPVRREAEVPVQGEEIEPAVEAADLVDEADESDDEQGADPILEQEEEDDSIVVDPSPNGRVED